MLICLLAVGKNNLKRNNMATRASVKFISKEGQTLVTIYKHYDGYPFGLGQDILNIISNKPITNGIKGQPKLGESFNGFDCLVASFISLTKTNVGDVYIKPENSFGELGENYLYTVQEQLDDSVEVFVEALGSQGFMPSVRLESLIGKTVN
jgi:hypothetical protein